MAVYVIGSMNIDMFFDVDHFVRPKETLMPERTQVLPGGKGLNQACACAKGKAQTWMAGKIGTDGTLLLDTLNKAGVDTTFVETEKDKLSGRAVIQRDREAENCILLDPGANHALDKEDFEKVLVHVGPEDIVLIQNEISNLDVLARLLKEKGSFVVFNPAPVTEDMPDDLSFVSCLVVNEVEVEQLLEKSGKPEFLCKEWLKRYPDSSIVLTLSSSGSLYLDKEKTIFMPAYKVHAVDTTGAGDTYTGFLCAMLDRGFLIETALQFASAASAIAVTMPGAASSIPNLDAVKEKIEQNEDVCPIRR